MKTVLKVLHLVEWAAAVLGAVILLLGMISWVLSWSILRVDSIINYFSVASSFFLLAIVLFLFIHLGRFKEE